MARIPSKLYTVAQVRHLDELAQSAVQGGADTLMARAGEAVLKLLGEKYPGSRRLLVLCGGGNNAGDGYVVARLAAEAGMEVAVLATVDPATLEGPAGRAAAAWLEAGGRVLGREALGEQWDILVDGLLGIGLVRPVEGELAELILAVNAYNAPVIAIDMPSGVHGDNGAVMGVAVNAVMTLSFIGLKRGAFSGEAPDFCGELFFNDLEVPAQVFQPVDPSGLRVIHSDLQKALSPRPKTAHKGQCGHVLIVGGNRGMSGAALIAAQAALRSGAGRVSIATRQSHAAVLNLTQPEIMCHAITELREFNALARSADVIAVGPGLGQDTWAEEVFRASLESQTPLVVDADGLNLLAREFVQRENWILTPHPGEAARLAGTDAVALQKDRFTQARELSNHYNAVVVLKGAGTLVTQPREESSYGFDLIDTGNPGMASGGMGDALTGVIASFVAQGVPLSSAAACGAYVHGLAGDRVARATGQRGMLATDLLPQLHKLVNP
ncbi:MAG: NAD(P)H-hydrate dehydratase [Pseudomonadota bacterium]